MMNQPFGTVYLLGAGPGAPDLITVRGMECLAKADVVIYDYLVNPVLLYRVNKLAELISLGDSEVGRRLSQEDVQAQMVEFARDGKTVVRLKGGDPFIFGRGGEESEALIKAGIPFEIVPGITAGSGASTYAGIPLTHREYSSAVLLATAHEDPKKQQSQLDWSAMASFRGTVVLYMGAERLFSICDSLIKAGMSGDTPAAVVVSGTLPNQKTISGTLKTIPEQFQQKGVASPAVIIIGPVTKLSERLQWFENKPLFGKSVVVTRPELQAQSFAAELRAQGAHVHMFPMIRIDPVEDYTLLDQVLKHLQHFDWIVFSSVNGVESFMKRLFEIGKDIRCIGNARLAAVGSTTSASLLDYGLVADVVPENFRSEALAETLADQVVGKRVLLARADRGRDVLPRLLRSFGAEVEEVSVYRNVDIECPDNRLRKMIETDTVDWITLTSPSIARSFVARYGDSLYQNPESKIRIASISPVTSQAAEKLGLEVNVEAEQYTLAGMIEAMIQDSLK